MTQERVGRLWHVTVTMAGDPVEPLLVRSAINRLRDERPFIDSVQFSGSGAELQFWDEGESMIDVASLALRMWTEHRASAGLPHWEIVGLEIVEKSVRDARSTTRVESVPRLR